MFLLSSLCSLFGSLTHACSWKWLRLRLVFPFDVVTADHAHSKQRRRKMYIFIFGQMIQMHFFRCSRRYVAVHTHTLSALRVLPRPSERKNKIKNHLMALAIFVFFFILFIPVIHTVRAYGGRTDTPAIQLCHNLLAINFYMNARCDQLINSVKRRNYGEHQMTAGVIMNQIFRIRWKCGSSQSPSLPNDRDRHTDKNHSNRRHQRIARF